MNVSLLRGVKFRHALVAFTGALCVTTAAFAANNKDKKNDAAGGSATYSGRAIALRIDGIDQPVSGPIIICDTGQLPSAGGAITVAQSDVNIANGGLTIDDVSASTFGGGPEATSDSTLSGYHVEFVESDGHHVTFDADYIYSRASVTAAKNGRISSDAEVRIQNLRINGKPITVTGEPNQVVNLDEDECQLVINEQTSAGGSDLAVAAIRFELCHCISGYIGLVTAGLSVNGTPPPPAEHDCGKITGGGWIIGTPSGAKGTFGMSGGVRRGEFWGHLTYVDHGTGMKVQSNAVTNFQVDPSDANGRIITYRVTINGAPGTATLRVVDNGEPGKNDIFDLTLSTGYHAAGDLGGGRPGGGNIQLHKCPKGWE